MRILLTSLFAFALSGCASSWPQTAELSAKRPQDLPARLELADVPFFPQVEYQCGPAALATALASSGVAVTPEDLVSQVYIPARKGSLQIEMMAAARRRGLVSYELAPRFEDLLREIAAGTPVIVLNNLAQTLADLGRHEEALPVIERAAGIVDAIAAKEKVPPAGR